MSELEKELKYYSLIREKEKNLGKRIGSSIWFHKAYIFDFLNKDFYEKCLPYIPIDYTIVKFDKKNRIISFIESKDFDESEEPTVGLSTRLSFDKDFILTKKTITKPSKNPLIYHHKWLMVRDSYENFNVLDSKKRSILWKKKLGVNKEISSKIGRLSFWKEWLHNNNIKG